ncbi:MAG: DNA-processing protein DprA [Holosporaceae bacterium]|nr:DNA-processing protein DprA [Holosporaceae bacterium]
MLSKEEKLARLRLYRSESIGPTRFWELINEYGSAVTVLTKGSGIFPRAEKKQNICGKERIEEEIAAMKAAGARFVFFEDELYPPLLRNIPDPPPVLSFLGDKDKVLDLFQMDVVAVVGARNASIAGCKFCQILCKDLGARDVVTVSGLARGIDTCAHAESLETGTIAVVAGGINVIYPRENTALYNEIIKKNGIFSEASFNTPPQPQLFPRRNRLIAGMSYGTAIIEAAEQSGSLITARMALDYNREVFAVPGSPLDPRSIGCNKLIKEGAILLLSVNDILEQLEAKKITLRRQTSPILTKTIDIDLELTRKKILDSLSSIPITIDELISCIKVSPQEVLSALLELELANKIVRLHGQRVCLALGS